MNRVSASRGFGRGMPTRHASLARAIGSRAAIVVAWLVLVLGCGGPTLEARVTTPATVPPVTAPYTEYRAQQNPTSAMT